ncbi:MAG: hypothetical protein AB1394_08075 [Bacteroidota bacterium]
MPFKKSASGYFSEYYLSRLNVRIRGIYVLKNERNEIILMRYSEDTIAELKSLYNSNDYCWRYNPKKFEIEDVYFKDLNARYAQLTREISTLMQQDIDLVSDW